MPEKRHLIRLHGPWNLSLFLDDVEMVATKVRFSSTKPWSESFQEALADFEITRASEPFELRLSRSFNWPNPEPVPTSIWLCIESQGEFQVALNQQQIEDAISTATDSQRFEVKEHLESHNQLELRFDLPSLSDPPDVLQHVALEIL